MKKLTSFLTILCLHNKLVKGKDTLREGIFFPGNVKRPLRTLVCWFGLKCKTSHLTNSI